VLNLLCGLIPSYDHLKALIKRTVPFPTFHVVRNELLLEELTITIEAPTPVPTLYSVTPGAQASSGGQAPPALRQPPPPPRLAPCHGPCGPSSGFHRRQRSSPPQGRAWGGSSTRGGSTSRGGGQGWTSFHNPWIGTISMWPNQAPSASHHPAPALLTASPTAHLRRLPTTCLHMACPRQPRPRFSSRLRGPLPRHSGPRSLEARTQPLSPLHTTPWRWLYQLLTRSSTPVHPTTPPPPKACYLAHTHLLPHTLPRSFLETVPLFRSPQ
jgi:hypothetical protein